MIITLSNKGKDRIAKNPSTKFNRDSSRQSYMEHSFENWLKANNMIKGMKGYMTELHIYNKITNKHGWVDFVFPRHHLIVELDGSQHLRPDRIQLDLIRDNNLRLRGWKVLRISHKEYQNGVYVDKLKDILF